MTPTIPTPALADLPEHRLDYIARQYFADEQYQHYVKHAISDAFQEARRAAQPNSPEFGGIAAQPVAPVQENSKREGFEAAAKALQERAAGHKRDGEYELYEECLECVSMLHDLKPAATPSPQIAEVAEPMAWMRKTDITELTDSEPETEGWTPLYATPAPASAGQAAPSSLAAKLTALRDEAEAERQSETNPNRERIYMGMRDAFNVAAILAAQPAEGAGQAGQVACSHVWNDFGQLGGRNVSWCPRCDTLAWTGKEPTERAAAPADPLDTPLPCDVKIGPGTIRKGVRLGVLVLRAQGLHSMLMEHMPKPTPEQQAAFDELLNRGAQPQPEAKGSK